MKYSRYTPDQKQEVIDLFNRAFSDADSEAEGAMVAQLAADFLGLTHQDDNLYVFVAQDENQRIVGSIIFSRLTFADETSVFILSPVAVATDYQGKGVGQALIGHGLDTLKAQGVSVVVTYGDINFYAKVGFAAVTEKVIPAPFKLSYPQGWIAVSLSGENIVPLTGKPSCLSPLDNPDIW